MGIGESPLIAMGVAFPLHLNTFAGSAVSTDG
jgi:hypothetical protein